MVRTPGTYVLTYEEAYPTRVYDPLTDYAITTAVPPEEAEQLRQQRITPLNGYIGQPNNYDDHDLTEEWIPIELINPILFYWIRFYWP
jgi:hypothetical protein